MTNPKSDTLKPGDQAPPGTVGTGENICPKCRGTGRSIVSLARIAGVQARLSKGSAEAEARAARVASIAALSPFLDVLAGRQVLIVEDELMIAWEIQRIVELLGCEVLGPARCVDAALALLQQSKPDAALLDINLREKAVTPVATECRRREVPFALVTAYARLDLGEPVLDGAVRVRKPWNDSDLHKVLVHLIDKRGLQA